MGRPAKTVAELKLAGTYRRDRHGSRVDGHHVAGLPARPSDLSDDQSRVWDTVVASLPPAAFSPADEFALRTAWMWSAILMRCQREIPTAANQRIA